MYIRYWLATAALNGFLAVCLGAFGVHVLDSRVSEHAKQLFETGARYQMHHSLAIGFAAFAMNGPTARLATVAAALFLVGIVLFSGSLYASSLAPLHGLAFLTPLGGGAFLMGWGALFWAAIQRPR